MVAPLRLSVKKNFHFNIWVNQMASFLITYDLKKTKDYPRLWEALRSLGACRPLLSVWVVKSGQTVQQLATTLQRFVDHDDKLLVVQLSGPWWSAHLSEAELQCLDRAVLARG